MKYILIILTVFLCLYSINSLPSFRFGTYRNEKPGKIEFTYHYFLKGIETYITGGELKINEDSTFVYTTCGNINQGRWYVQNDSLYLVVTQNRWRNDSLNKYGYEGKWPQIPSNPIGFKIKKNSLEQVRISQSGRKEINKLINNAP